MVFEIKNKKKLHQLFLSLVTNVSQHNRLQFRIMQVHKFKMRSHQEQISEQNLCGYQKQTQKTTKQRPLQQMIVLNREE